MEPAIKNFIETNIDLIQKDKWGKVQLEAYKCFSLKNTGKFNYALIQAGIDPIAGLAYVPTAFLYATDIDNYHLSNDIVNIYPFAFEECNNLTTFIIPDSVKYISSGAFSYCAQLRKVIIGKSVETMEGRIFENCQNLVDISFNGTKKQWEDMDREVSWIRNVPVSTIKCSDGVIYI